MKQRIIKVTFSGEDKDELDEIQSRIARLLKEEYTPHKIERIETNET